VPSALLKDGSTSFLLRPQDLVPIDHSCISSLQPDPHDSSIDWSVEQALVLHSHHGVSL
jgi:hypothetical protein